jgi:hypothetical protein
MDYPELAQIDMDDYREVRNPACGRARAKMILHAAAFIAIATVGVLIGGVLGAATVVVWWTAALIVGKRLWTNNVQAPAGPAERPQASEYADIEDVNDILEDLAQRRNWDLDKRFDIARMACENRTTTFDELERRYDRGVRSVFARLRQGIPKEPKNDESD